MNLDVALELDLPIETITQHCHFGQLTGSSGALQPHQRAVDMPCVVSKKWPYLCTILILTPHRTLWFNNKAHIYLSTEMQGKAMHFPKKHVFPHRARLHVGSSEFLWVKAQCISISLKVIEDNRCGYDNRNLQERHKENLNALGNILGLNLVHW